MGCYPVTVVNLHAYKIRNWLLLNLSREGYMRSMKWQLGILGIISAFAYRHRETKKKLRRSRYRHKDNIEMDDRDFVCSEIDTNYLRN